MWGARSRETNGQAPMLQAIKLDRAWNPSSNPGLGPCLGGGRWSRPTPAVPSTRPRHCTGPPPPRVPHACRFPLGRLVILAPDTVVSAVWRSKRQDDRRRGGPAQAKSCPVGALVYLPTRGACRLPHPIRAQILAPTGCGSCRRLFRDPDPGAEATPIEVAGYLPRRRPHLPLSHRASQGRWMSETRRLQSLQGVHVRGAPGPVCTSPSPPSSSRTGRFSSFLERRHPLLSIGIHTSRSFLSGLLASLAFVVLSVPRSKTLAFLALRLLVFVFSSLSLIPFFHLLHVLDRILGGH